MAWGLWGCEAQGHKDFARHRDSGMLRSRWPYFKFIQLPTPSLKPPQRPQALSPVQRTESAQEQDETWRQGGCSGQLGEQ